VTRDHASAESNNPDSPVARTLIVNSLVDCVGGTGETLADERSRAIITEAYEEAVPDSVRNDLDSHLHREVNDPDSEEVTGPLLEASDRVLEFLSRSNVIAKVDHELDVGLSMRSAILYSFFVTPTLEKIEQLEVQPAIDSLIRRGSEYALRENYKHAIDIYERAIDRASNTDAVVSTLALAAWANYQNRNDDRAVALVKEAMEHEDKPWEVLVIALAAGDSEPDQFRSGKYGIRAFLRWTADVPEGASLDTAIGLANDGDGFEWTELAGHSLCTPVVELEPSIRVRFSLECQLPSFPTLYGYYLAIGKIDLETTQVYSVDHLLASGPFADKSSESISYIIT
jgi:tetratricopeptide (TPR) repeat protein